MAQAWPHCKRPGHAVGADVGCRLVPARDWDSTAWQMVGRPERCDPDEFIYNLFHSSTPEKGYNFIGYLNPEYDAVAEAQRSQIDPESARRVVFEAQETP